jgi:hypothetical protein
MNFRNNTPWEINLFPMGNTCSYCQEGRLLGFPLYVGRKLELTLHLFGCCLKSRGHGNIAILIAGFQILEIFGP